MLLVAPPSPLSPPAIPAIAGFVAPVDPASVRSASRTAVRLVASDADVYSTEGTAHALYGGPLGLDSDVLPGAGHLTIEDGYGPWPAVLAWALDPATRIT